MSQLSDRIAQFRKMATDDPDNELGHYRLGQLLLEDKQYEQAVASFRRTLELSPQFSKVYQLLAQTLLASSGYDTALQAFRTAFPALDPQMPSAIMADYAAEQGREDLAGSLRQASKVRAEAIAVLEQGFAVADERGDRMPRDEMGRMLVALGRPAPEPRREAPAPVSGPAGPAGEGGFRCQRPGCMAGAHARPLTSPPMNDDVGRRVMQSVCADCWTSWLRDQSIKVINELRLDLSTERGQEEYDRYLREYLGLE